MATDTLQSKLDDHKKQFLAKAPPEVIEVVKEKGMELATWLSSHKHLGKGDQAPEFELPGADGATVSSKQLLQQGPLVMTFYRGNW